MKHWALGIGVLGMLWGCTPDQAEDATGGADPPANASGQATADPPEISAGDGPYAWAEKLIAQSAKWDTVTPEPDPINLSFYTLCRAPLPGEAPGPHGIRDAWPQGNTPGNHVVVSPKGRGYFYQQPDTKQPVAIDQPFPQGTTIIKEKYDDLADAQKREKTRAYGVMIKREAGYNPDQGDWEYAYIDLDQDGNITSATRGKLKSCIDCHGNQANNDYVFRSYGMKTFLKP